MLKEKTLQELGASQVLLKTLYLSNDPAQRVWISKIAHPERFYVPPVAIGHTMRAGAICEVVQSNSEKFGPGALVKCPVGWTELSVQEASHCTPIPSGGELGVTQFLGALGTTGLTAYYGLVEVAKARAGEVVVVSGAAGATGSMAVQIAKKILKCRKVRQLPLSFHSS
jgi:NADPH-dependent curcumin reductase CurA